MNFVVQLRYGQRKNHGSLSREFLQYPHDRPLSQAFDYALKASRTPMRFYGRQSRSEDVRFAVGPQKIKVA
jgi:hypothetical protein